jgi:DNA-binding SARP family transcriptional activator
MRSVGQQPDDYPAPLVRLVLLGGFRAERTDSRQHIDGWQRRSAKSLTKLLATSPGHALHREQIIEFLWPGVDAESGLNSFGKALHAARRAFEPELQPRQSSAYLCMTDSMLALSDCVEVDADRFEQLAETALRRRDIPAYKSALAAYGGDLLPEDRYADWCVERRSFLAELYSRLQLGLAEALANRGAYNDAADCLRAVLRQEPTREEVHRRLMRLYVDMGTPDQSVRQFQVCQDRLRRELDLAPQPETVELFQDVLGRRKQEQRGSPRAHEGHPAGSPLPAIGEPTPRRPFVGREPLLATLSKQLGKGSKGGAGMVLLSGDAGVGKTRLLEEFAIRASRHGAAVLWGGSGAHAKHFAYGPFAVALERFVASRSESERAGFAKQYPALSAVVPSLGVTPPRPGGEDGRADQVEVARALVRLLTDVGHRQPVVLVLGDLHDIDPFSLELLRFIAHLAIGRRWLAVGAVREEDVEPGSCLHDLIDVTTRERLCLTLEVPCLSLEETGQLVRALLPKARVNDELIRLVFLRSRGNPLFVEELVVARPHALALTGDARDAAQSPASHVPQRVRALASARMAQMSETGRRVLGLAAAASASEISLGELRTGAAALEPPIPDGDLLSALDRALETHLLEERRSGYAFRYPLLRSAVYQQLPKHRREQLRGALSGPGRAREQHWNNRRASSRAR